MISWPSEYEFRQLIFQELLGLEIATEWIGDPATSTFGIQINLLHHGNVISSTVVDFIGKTFD